MASDSRRTEENMEMYEIDLTKATRAMKRLGLSEFFFEALPEREYERAQELGLSVLQWKLYKSFRKMLGEELLSIKMEKDLEGQHFRVYGLSFKQIMDMYPDICEDVFGEWALRLGVNHLYADSLGADVHELTGHVFKNSSGKSIYERFVTLLKKLS